MIKQWCRSVSLMSILLMISVAAGADNNELSFQKNRAKRDGEAQVFSSTLPTLTPGQVLGTHPFFAKLSVNVYEKNGGIYQQVTSPIANLKPGMILDLPLYESETRTSTRVFGDTALPQPTEIDNYYWSDWDMGDRDVLPENSDLEWFILTLKDEYKAPNVAQCNLLGLSAPVIFTADESDNQRWKKLELAAEQAGELVKNAGSQPKILQNNDNTPWGDCFTETEVIKADLSDPALSMISDSVTEHAIVIPTVTLDQRIGFKVTPDSLLGFPQKGYQAFVWDVSQIWAQQSPIKTENVVVGQSNETGENQFTDIQVVFPEFEAANGINSDMSLPFAKHPLIGSPQIEVRTDEYYVYIYDYEAYQAGKRVPVNSSDNETHTALSNKGTENTFVVNKDYIVVFELRTADGEYRSLQERELALSNEMVAWNLYRLKNTQFDGQASPLVLAEDWKATRETDGLFITQKYLLDDVAVKIRKQDGTEITFAELGNTSETEVEGVIFNTQIRNGDPLMPSNPEASQQTFRADVSFKYCDATDTEDCF